jgi:catechol 2,3-dioxygenase-like lactoylglutathione lyase family enzyme
MKPRISIVTLGVRDFAKSLAFYRDGLGFTPHNYKDGEEHVMFKMEGSWLSLYPRHLLADDATVPGDGRGFSGVTLAHNVKSKADADRVFAQAVGAGAKPVKTPQESSGAATGYFADPDGHLWEVAWNPFTDLT